MIQNTVADLVRLATRRVIELREERNLPFKIINQIHDALFIEAPIPLIKECNKCLIDGMSEVYVPMPSGERMHLRVDTDIYSRWGEAYVEDK